MNIVFFGNHIYGYNSLFEMIKAGVIPKLVVTNIPKKEEKEWYPSVHDLALRHNIKIIRTNKTKKNDELKYIIESLSPDLFVVSSYRNIIDKDLIYIPKFGAINLHMAPLPKYRGAHPENWASINGEKQMGYTVHYLVEEIDAGDIIAQKSVKILMEDDILSLTFKLAEAGAKLLLEVISNIKKGHIIRKSQIEKEATYYRPRKPSDGLINWYDDEIDIYNLVRSLTRPYPGAFTYLFNRKLTIWRIRIMSLEESSKAKPGEIIRFDSDSGILVKTGGKPILIIDFNWEDQKLPENVKGVKLGE